MASLLSATTCKLVSTRPLPRRGGLDKQAGKIQVIDEEQHFQSPHLLYVNLLLLGSPFDNLLRPKSSGHVCGSSCTSTMQGPQNQAVAAEGLCHKA
jgi:hypothetical protein